MIHGPCGYLNPTCPCMKTNHCKFKYPKQLSEQTTKGKNSYPIYERQLKANTMQFKGYNIDNTWVVPYNPYLLCKFNCHINVEVCSDIKVVKYIYKYICKGHDKIAFSIHNNQSNVEIDEIKEYQAARWVSPGEVAWLYQLQSASTRIPICILYEQSNVDQILNNPMIRRTMLTEFFEMNRINKNAIELNLLYKDFPKYFVWSTTDRMWSHRQQHTNAIGRIVTCHPTEGERYYLRLLLTNVRGPTSYEDLRTINGICYDTFRSS
ncbi:hypothetical protein H5410_064708 [Solanum commersonii]|uniref:Helitron helicase-like domain-containing protein n=1 Tax=Solanum commersonii TaxID=4109 RepID=A0A9J5VYM7_SOLCO|nr:hypothetical protein H5410_064708 [Solanum commersonii]